MSTVKGRGSQLVRPMVLFKFIALSHVNLDKVDCDYLARVFKVHRRTIRRDLDNMVEAGWIEYWLPAPRRPRERKTRPKKIKPKGPGSGNYTRVRKTGVTAAIAAKVKGLNLTRCNSCPYQFKILPTGRLDMDDFRKHKEKHR